MVTTPSADSLEWKNIRYSKKVIPTKKQTNSRPFLSPIPPAASKPVK